LCLVYNWDAPELSLLKSTAIYGANASGKSNLTQAIDFMKRFVINSSTKMQITDKIPVESFRLSTETENKPSFFQMVFYLNKRVYRYGFEVSSKAVIKEWLYQTVTDKESRLFERQNQEFTINKKSFKEGLKSQDQTKPNSLFVSLCSQFNGKVSTSIVIWFSQLLVISGLGIYDNFHKRNALNLFEDDTLKKDSLKLIQQLDISIENFDISKEKINSDSFPSDIREELKILLQKLSHEPEAINVMTSHKKYNHSGEFVGIVNFDLEENESEGTKKLFYFIPIFLTAFVNRQILVIDELDTRLHPSITHKLIELFNSSKYNPKNHWCQLKEKRKSIILMK
jgi:AAA15 family ATPase/GTPase